MRRFELHREVDLSGVSGTGIVAEGIEYGDGSVALRWLTKHSSTAVWAGVQSVEIIHGHGGTTRVIWIDDADVLREVADTSEPDETDRETKIFGYGLGDEAVDQ